MTAIPFTTDGIHGYREKPCYDFLGAQIRGLDRELPKCVHYEHWELAGRRDYATK